MAASDYFMFHYLMLYNFNDQLFDNALVAVALIPVKLFIVSWFNVAVF